MCLILRRFLKRIDHDHIERNLLRLQPKPQLLTDRCGKTNSVVIPYAEIPPVENQLEIVVFSESCPETISYNVLAGIGQRVKRVYVK